MAEHRPLRTWAPSILAAATLAGCGSTAKDLLATPTNLVTATTEVITKMPIPKLEAEPKGSATELYTRIARGAGLCWFGTHGEFRETHIFNAEAQPASKGGRAEIVVHERDMRQVNPRGNRAFRVIVEPNGDNASLQIENMRFPMEVAQRMTTDVRRWARDEITCREEGQTKGWEAKEKPAEPDQPAKPARKPGERKT